MKGEVNSSRSEFSRWREIIRVYIKLSMRLEVNNLLELMVSCA